MPLDGESRNISLKTIWYLNLRNLYRLFIFFSCSSCLTAEFICWLMLNGSLLFRKLLMKPGPWLDKYYNGCDYSRLWTYLPSWVALFSKYPFISSDVTDIIKHNSSDLMYAIFWSLRKIQCIRPSLYSSIFINYFINRQKDMSSDGSYTVLLHFLILFFQYLGIWDVCNTVNEFHITFDINCLTLWRISCPTVTHFAIRISNMVLFHSIESTGV